MSSRWDTATRAAWHEWGRRHSSSIIAGEFVRVLWPVWMIGGIIVVVIAASRRYDLGGTFAWFGDHWFVIVIVVLGAVALWRGFRRQPWE